MVKTGYLSNKVICLDGGMVARWTQRPQRGGYSLCGECRKVILHGGVDL